MPGNSEETLVLKNVTFSYNGDAPVLEKVNFSFTKEFFLLKGPSGAGKSTLLRLLCKLDVPRQGEIFYRGTSFKEWNSNLLRIKVSYLQQAPVMLPGTVKENLLLPFKFRQLRNAVLPEDGIIEEWLEYFLLNEISPDHRADKLSVGQKQRLALIRSLLLNPEILLLDEPTASLDPEARRLVEHLLERLNRESGIGIIMVSHNDFLPTGVTVRRVFLANRGLEERTDGTD